MKPAQEILNPLSSKKKLKDAQKRLKESEKKDYYKILDVSRTASDRDIKKAYRKLAMEWHPDKWANGTPEEKAIADAKFRDINDAQSILTDPKKRAMFDNGEDMTGGGGGGEYDMHDIFAHMGRSQGFPQGGGFRSGGGSPFGGFNFNFG